MAALAFDAEGWLWFKKRVPHEISSLSVHMRGGEPQLWEIESARSQDVLVTYGTVPQGFFQRVPAKGAPTTLQPGTTYYISARGGGFAARAFELRGKSEKR